ncbi:MAG TPA: hypothetical protein VF950_11525 [Planctomycetota bacterium]
MRIALLLTLAGCASGPPPLPPDLLSKVESALRDLPPGAEDYFFMEDAERLALLRESGRGTPEDQEFLEKRMLGEQIPRVKADAARAAQPRPVRSARVAPPVPAGPPEGERPARGTWTITLTDGRKLRGTLVEATETRMKFKVKEDILITFDRKSILHMELAPE